MYQRFLITALRKWHSHKLSRNCTWYYHYHSVNFEWAEVISIILLGVIFIPLQCLNCVWHRFYRFNDYASLTKPVSPCLIHSWKRLQWIVWNAGCNTWEGQNWYRQFRSSEKDPIASVISSAGNFTHSINHYGRSSKSGPLQCEEYFVCIRTFSL